MNETSQASIERKLKLLLNKRWFHSIRFNDHMISKGRFADNRPQNYTLFGVLYYLEHIEIYNMNCLDIGTMNGLIAFTLKQKNARKVIATDMAYQETFDAGKNFLDLDIDYKYPVSINELPDILNGLKLDLIVCSGILYHVFEPLSSLIVCREQLKENGLLILETHYLFDRRSPVISFSPGDMRRGSDQANTFFIPSYSALIGMIEMAGFEIVSTISINGRITVLARAARPSTLKASTPTIEKICRTYMNYYNYRENIDYNRLNNSKSVSPIKFNVPYKSNYWIYSSRFVSENKLQPEWNPDFSTKTKGIIRDFVFKIRTCITRRTLLKNIG